MSNTDAPMYSRDAYSITSLAFAGLRPTECYRMFKAYTLHKLHKLVTAVEYRYHHERATLAADLSPPLQALLQVLDAIQPATRWTAEDRSNTITFTPMDVDYNLFRLQSMPSSLYLTHPKDPSTPSGILFAPRASAHICGGTPSRHHGGALLSWCSLPLHCLFPACPHMTQTLPKNTRKISI